VNVLYLRKILSQLSTMSVNTSLTTQISSVVRKILVWDNGTNGNDSSVIINPYKILIVHKLLIE